MSAMSSDLAQPPEQPARDGEPVLVSALVAAAVVTVFLIFDHWWSLHGIPTVLRWWGSAPFDAYIFIVSMVPAALLAVVLAIWGIDGRHRLAGALGALAAGLVDWGLQEVFQHYVLDQGHTSGSALVAYDWVVTLLIPTMATVVWGLGRRRGYAWLLGVPVAPLLAGLHRQAQLHWSPFQTWQGRHDAWWVHGLEFLAPIVVACVVCWLIERAVTRT
jgi:hypothetical protein